MRRWTPIRQPTTSLMLDAMIVGAAWGILAILVAVGMLVYGAFRTPAKAHGAAHWIEDQRLVDPVTKVLCCGTKDCMEESGNISAVSGGFLVKSTGEVIAARRVIWRSPGGWWRCRNLSTNETRCLLGPPTGS